MATDATKYKKLPVIMTMGLSLIFFKQGCFVIEHIYILEPGLNNLLGMPAAVVRGTIQALRSLILTCNVGLGDVQPSALIWPGPHAFLPGFRSVPFHHLHLSHILTPASGVLLEEPR